MFIPLNKSSVNKTELSRGKIRGKIGFGGGGEKETWRVGKEIFQ
jgi:hypothetical protein